MRKINCYKLPRRWKTPKVFRALALLSGILLVILFLASCASNKERPYYSRTKGGYLHPAPDKKAAPLQKAPEEHPPKKEIVAKKEALAKQKSPLDAPEMREPAKPKLKEVADSYLGVPYRWAGQSRKGMDCSGFIRTVFQQVYNVKLPHSSKELGKMGEAVNRSGLKKGDIVLFGSVFGIHHAGIYMHGDQFIHSSTKRGVIYSSLSEPYYQSKYKGARRIL